MTLALSRNPAYAAIRSLSGPSPLWGVGGISRKILVAAKQSGKMVFLGESADLGSEVLGVNTETSPNCHVLTANGLTRVTNTDSPQIVSETRFDPGGGNWLHMFGGVFLATPLARGGVQVVAAGTGAQISTVKGVCADSRFAAADTYYKTLWVVDAVNARIATFIVSGDTGAITYVGRVAAPNCRDIVKVVADTDEGNLFVVCRRRIVRFTIPTTAVTDPDARLPVFAQDYGVSSVDYTDFVVMAQNQYWVYLDSAFTPTPLNAYYGPLYGSWDPDEGESGEMFVAAPESGLWTISNATPAYTAATIPAPVIPPVVPPVDPPIAPPPVVVLPAAPVITSTLTASVTEDTAFSYTITATGTGPIYYDVVSPPSWLTSINHLTGAISGVPPDPGAINITITATNAGGTGSATLAVTVLSAIGDMSAVRVNGGISDAWLDPANFKLYIIGGGTLVTDASGSYARSQAACLDLRTGLWTAWAPTLSSSNGTIWSDPATPWVYIGGAAGVNGSPAGRTRRVDKSTGASDATFDIVNTGVDYAVEASANVWAGASTALCRLHTSTGDVDTAGTTPGVDLSQYVRGAASVPYEAALNAFPQAITPSGVVCGFTGPVGRGGGESSPPYRARGVGVADPSTGVLYQSGVGPSSAGVPRIEKHIVNGRLICTTPMSVVHDMNLSTVQSGLNNICVLASDLSTFYPFNVTFVSATVDRCGAVDIDSNVFIASQITSVGGDSARKGIFKMDSSGNLVSAFNPAWAGGTPDILRVDTIGGAVFVMGSWSAAVTIAGQARPNFAVLRADTGALY